jgi:hypothetical protein
MAQKLIASVIFGSLVYLTALALGPRVPQSIIERDRLWLQNIYFSDHFGLSLNMDSYFYMRAANEPGSIFEPRGAIVQSRPLLSFIAYPLSRLFMWPGLSVAGAPPMFVKLLPTYLAFLVLNLAFVVASYWVYARVVLPANAISSTPSAFLIGSLLIANEITKAFFFAAHAQMLNLLVPLIALFELMNLRVPGVPSRRYIVDALLTGFAMLAYGGAAVIGAAIVLARIWRYTNDTDRSLRPLVGELLLIFIMLALPYLSWWHCVVVLTGGFYNHEIVRWRQIVWMLEVFENGWFWLVSTFASNIGFFFVAGLHHLVPAIPVLVLVLPISFTHRRALRQALKTDMFFFVGATIIGVMCLLFFSAVGYRVTRLAMPAAVMAIAVLGRWTAQLEALLGERQRRQLCAAVAIIIVADGIWIAAKEGPFY